MLGATSSSHSSRATGVEIAGPDCNGNPLHANPVIGDALYDLDPEMRVNIEHGDVSVGQMEGLEVAAQCC